MTSPAFVVLMLALVCSTCGIIPEQTVDQPSKHAMHKQNDFATNKMRPLTNMNKHIVNKLDVNNVKYKGIKQTNSVYTNVVDIEDKYKDISHDIATKEIEHENGKFDDILNAVPKIDSMNKFSNLHDKSYHNKHSKYKRPQFDEIYTDGNEENFSNRKSEKYGKYNEFITKNKKGSQTIFTKRKVDLGDGKMRYFDPNKYSSKFSERIKRDAAQVKVDSKCDEFTLEPSSKKIYHPHNPNAQDKNYYSNITCVLVLQANDKQVIKLTFVDVFHIEDHPKCTYDYLEVRDGKHGYDKPFGKFCGSVFPRELTSTGPYMWLKFRSDETIEYEGFTIKVENVTSASSHKIPDSCYEDLSGPAGEINTDKIKPECKTGSADHALDVLWKIETAPNTDIYLNFSSFDLAKPNECEQNVVQVFGYLLEDDAKLAHYCGSAANAVSTRVEGKSSEQGNIMYVHIFMSQVASKDTKVKANFTAFRTVDPADKADNGGCTDDEFNCEDNTCIALDLKCDEYAHCRLKADEDPVLCRGVQESLLSKPHILVILVIFSLILSGMSFVFLFKCIKKLYQDHKAIKEHIRQSTEDRLDTLITGSRLILDPKSLRDQPRASLERENHTNELYKQQRSISQHKGLPQQTSIESDFQETHLDLDDEPWQRNVETVPETQDAKAERNGRIRRSDTSKKEESLRNHKEIQEEKKEIRDAAVGAPDTKESGCQTRESLFQTEPAPSSDGSNSASNSRGFSTFGYSGATLVRPSPPPAAAAPTPAPAISSAQIELLRQLPSFDTSHKTLKKIPDRRPMSAETTRSAPDVIIVSKPIR